jgi:hypothetical protein
LPGRNRNGERVGRIIGRDFFFDIQRQANHPLYLFFISSPLPGNCLLHLKRCELVDRQVVVVEGKKYYATRLTNINSGFGVIEKKEFFHRRMCWFVKLNKVLKRMADKEVHIRKQSKQITELLARVTKREEAAAAPI